MTTMLDKCAVAGDITQGIDRRGVWTAAITVIGGTSGTAVKLVSSDTVNGEYTDYKTLISASDAETDQYKGFVVDLHGAKKYIKVTGAVMATAVFGDCDHDVKAIAITAGEVPSGADLEDNKAATIDASTYTSPVEVTPSEGKDGMKKATITVSNIPEIEANKAQTIDVSTYTEPVEIEPTEGKDGMAKATVTLSNIPSGGNDDLQLYYWVDSEESESGFWTVFAIAPEALSKQQEMCFSSASSSIANVYSLTHSGNYAKISDTSFVINERGGSFTYVRNSENDTTLSALVAGE